MSSSKNIRDFEGKSFNEEASKRREWLEAESGVKLRGLGIGVVDEGWRGRNIENCVGVVAIPVGVTQSVNYGLLAMGSGREFEEKVSCYLPLATTEGALVASVSRGCKVIGQSGGARVVVEEMGMSRAPVFRVSGVEEGIRVRRWVEGNVGKIKAVSEETDKKLKFLKAEVFMSGRSVWVRFSFGTGEAMGMNMVTIATAKVVELMERELSIKCVALSGNVCCDKKVAGVNQVLGRGKRVWAEVVVREEVLDLVLKTTAEKIVEVWMRKTVAGSMVAGAKGLNAQAANIVAAMFLATGQDMAHVVHGSVAETSVEKVEEGLYVSVYLPELPVGTVGGGTMGKSQRECLGLLGVADVKKGDGLRLAAAVAVGVLAGEISLHAALASGDLAKAHKRLGRGGVAERQGGRATKLQSYGVTERRRDE